MAREESWTPAQLAMSDKIQERLAAAKRLKLGMSAEIPLTLKRIAALTDIECDFEQIDLFALRELARQAEATLDRAIAWLRHYDCDVEASEVEAMRAQQVSA